MHIVQIMPEFGLAGAEIMCENLIYELIKLGHQVTVISMYDYHSAITDRLENTGVKIIYLNKKIGLDISVIIRLKRILKQIKPDVIHTHRNCPQYAVPAAIMAGIKCRVHTMHSIAKKENVKIARKLNKLFFKYCGLIPVALSESIRRTVIEEYNIKEEKVPVVYNGIDLSKCNRKQDYFVNDVFKILHVGRFSEAKNHIGLLEAFKLFCSKYSDCELWLIGKGEKEKEIENYVKDNGLTSNVRFFGTQKNIFEFMHDADIFTLPSNYEGIPMTLIEAMGTGLPIVATAVGGVPDMLDESCAKLVPINSEAIADAFEKYYLDSQLRKRHGQAALVKSELFSSIEMAKKYIQIYNYHGGVS